MLTVKNIKQKKIFGNCFLTASIHDETDKEILHVELNSNTMSFYRAFEHDALLVFSQEFTNTSDCDKEKQLAFFHRCIPFMSKHAKEVMEEQIRNLIN